MHFKKSISSKIFDLSNLIFLSLLTVIAFYPFWYVVCVAFSNPKLFAAFQGIVIKPVGFSLASFAAVFKNSEIYTGYLNTLFYVVGGTFFNIIGTCVAAYGLSRRDFMWKKPLTVMVLITMFFNGGLIPNYLLIKNIGLLNNPFVLILPTLISAFNLMILKTAFLNMPYEIEEASKIDGANDFIILVRIIIPLTLPSIAVIVLYYAVSHWNSWFFAMIYLSERKYYPLQLFLREILISNNTSNMMQDTVTEEREYISQTIQYATIIVATLPILLAYPFLQRYFVKGVMVGAVKG